MPIDPSIALQYRGVEVPNQLAGMAQVAQIRAAQQQNELTQAKLEELKADRLEMEGFRQHLVEKGGNPDLNVYADMLIRSRNPERMSQGVTLKTKLTEQAKADQLLRTVYPQMFGGAAPANAMAPAPAAPGVEPAAAPTNAMAPAPAAAPAPTNAMAAPTGRETPEDLQRKIMLLSGVSSPAAQAMLKIEQARYGEAIKPPVYHNVPGVGLVNPQTQTVVMPSARTSTLLTPEEEAQQLRIAKEKRPPPAEKTPPAPTLTTIQDQKDPTRNIVVDARTGQVIGVAPAKESGAKTAKQEAAARGREELSTELDSILDAYDELDRLKAIPSTKRGTLSNLSASAGASSVGQMLGRAAGTEEQTQRDFINGARMRLLMAIKNATGMSSQQLNSNVELKAWLDSVSDPKQSIETVKKTLGELRRTYLKPEGEQPAVAAGATSVTLPDGRTMNFPNAAAAAEFKKAAGL